MCEDVDPEVIALVFHECNQNMQKTIARIKAGELQVKKFDLQVTILMFFSS